MVSNAGQSFVGIYSDGKSAGARDVLVRITGNGLELEADGEDDAELWPFTELVSSSPLIAGEPANIGNRQLEGARLYIIDGAFAARLLERAPQLSSHAERRRVLMPIFVLLLAIAVIGGTIWISGWSLASTVVDHMPDKIRYALGDEVLRIVTEDKQQCEGKEGLAALEKIKQRLNTGIKGHPDFHIMVADLDMINAFAVPGERIVVSRQLVDFVGSAEELAGIIAHEMGHGIEQHPEIGLVRSLELTALFTLITGGSPGQLGNFSKMMVEMSYSRSAEREADNHALDILQRAQLPSKPLQAFFVRLKHKQKDLSILGGEFSSAARLLSTHPSLDERIASIGGQSDYQIRPLLSTTEWQQLRAICE